MSSVLNGKHIVLGVTGGIAAYKACELASRLHKAGACVKVIMTKHACEFVCPQTFETLTGNPVCTDMFKREQPWEVEHIALASEADLFVIAPATANIIGKMACGIADDMLSTTVMATKAPVLLAPAMNTNMWENPATQSNMALLEKRGVLSVGPEGGRLACGTSGMGRMSEPEAIYDRCVEILGEAQDLQGIRLLVTAGPTREPLDPVRFITNHSSGKMGYALAERAAKRGASVTLVTGPVSIAQPAVDKVIGVETTEDLYSAMMAECGQQDVIIQSAAPADFAPVTYSDKKIKKNGDGNLVVEFRQTADIAKAIGGKKRDDQVFVGFAAETNDIEKNALKKLKSKNLDLIVANDVSMPGAGFGVDTNIVTMYTPDSTESLPQMSKLQVADEILNRVLALLRKKR